jgi:calcium-binding protein CML
LLKAFFVFDENKDGLISVLELQQVLLKLGLPEGKSLISCQRMIERVDSDGNGKVDFFEFKDMMSSNAFSFCNS